MKRIKTVVIVNGDDKFKFYRKIEILVVLLIVLSVSIYAFVHQNRMNNSFSAYVENINMLNNNTIFSIDKIYLYSSASATNNTDARPIWNLNVNQYTDIALFINNRYDQGLNYSNSIKSLEISDISFNKGSLGTPGLYYKDIKNFANFELKPENKIDDKLEYTVVNVDEVDTSLSQIYSNCQNPITLEYINENIKTNYLIENQNETITFNGNLLRMAEVPLTDIKCTVSFKITIINYYNQKFIANVYIDIPLEDTYSGVSIYNGKIVKKLENTNLIKFFRYE